MLKTIALAAASAALMIGAAAVAQTSTPSDQSSMSQPSTQAAPSADQNGTNTAATDQSATTGENG